jgi:hypothetical protein
MKPRGGSTKGTREDQGTRENKANTEPQFNAELNKAKAKKA